MAREIILVNSNQKATVDDEDYEFINQFTWFEENGYAVTYDFGHRVEMGYLVLKHASAEKN